jgi:membrane protease YdiL (CAAX protease family)
MRTNIHLNSTRSEASRRRSGAFLAALGLLALALVPLGQVFLGVGIVGGVTAAVVGAIGARTDDSGVVRLGVLALLLGLIGLSGLPFGIWIAVAALWLLSRAFPRFAPARGWLPVGRSSPILWWLTGGTVLLAGGGLTVWSLLASDPVQGTTAQLVDAARAVPGWAIAVFVVAFVPLNAIAEEIAYRGIAFDAANEYLPVILSLVGQAVAFGTLHVAGFPSGLAGIGLAVGYGTVIGLIRHISGGLRFPVIAHMAADATIAILVLGLLLPE